MCYCTRPTFSMGGGTRWNPPTYKGAAGMLQSRFFSLSLYYFSYSRFCTLHSTGFFVHAGYHKKKKNFPFSFAAAIFLGHVQTRIDSMTSLFLLHQFVGRFFDILRLLGKRKIFVLNVQKWKNPGFLKTLLGRVSQMSAPAHRNWRHAK